jgi:hypothetical protein
LRKSISGTRCSAANRRTPALNASVTAANASRRADLAPELTTEVPDHPQLPLQLRNVDVQIHTVDALHLEQDMIGKHISRGTR